MMSRVVTDIVRISRGEIVSMRLPEGVYELKTVLHDSAEVELYIRLESEDEPIPVPECEVEGIVLTEGDSLEFRNKSHEGQICYVALIKNPRGIEKEIESISVENVERVDANNVIQDKATSRSEARATSVSASQFRQNYEHFLNLTSERIESSDLENPPDKDSDIETIKEWLVAMESTLSMSERVPDALSVALPTIRELIQQANVLIG